MAGPQGFWRASQWCLWRQKSIGCNRSVPTLNAVGPWGIINHQHDTLVFSEEVYAHTRQDYAARSPESKLRAIAFVIGPKVEGAGLLKPKFKALLEGVMEAQVFADGESARLWMLRQLAKP